MIVHVTWPPVNSGRLSRISRQPCTSLLPTLKSEKITPVLQSNLNARIKRFLGYLTFELPEVIFM